MDKNKIQHDFVNNGLRLDVLNKLITEQLDAENKLNNEYLDDLEHFLIIHQDLVKKLKELNL